MPRPNPNLDLYTWILKRLDKCRLEDMPIYDDLAALARMVKKELEREGTHD